MYREGNHLGILGIEFGIPTVPTPTGHDSHSYHSRAFNKGAPFRDHNSFNTRVGARAS
jgi:hypothetical protein